MPETKEIRIEVEPYHTGKRLDIFLCDYLNKNGLCLSRQQVKKMILNSLVLTIDGNQLKPHYKVKSRDIFKVFIELKSKDIILPQKIDLEIIYQDQDLAIINKPAGLVVHPGAGNPKDTLVNALVYLFEELSNINPQRPGIVHRLDKDTSGIMVIAKNNFCHLELCRQFSQHKVEKKYIAVVKGSVEFDEGIVDLPIGRDPYCWKKMRVGFSLKNKKAITYYKVLKRNKDMSLLELHPVTGRTHQLRVHLAYLGYPILGDVKYAKDKNFYRLALHAFYLSFRHPRTKKMVEFRASVPGDFLELFREK